MIRPFLLCVPILSISHTQTSQNNHTFILISSQLHHKLIYIEMPPGSPPFSVSPEGIFYIYIKEESTLIEVNNLVKRYGDHTAVDHLSFKIEKGKIYGFLGPNGAGKSTTMNMITGYIASTEGTVKIDGHDILEEPEEAKKCIGYLPEQPPLYFDMTVLEYMKFVADLKKIPKDKKANMIEEVMEMVKISDMRNRLIKNLSKGYRQRVGLAEAIMGYPEVIILDEPTVGLDPKQIIEIRTLIKNLKKKHTVILSSHILSEVSAVCDYVLIISHGKLVASDTPENLGKLAEGSNTLEMLVKGAEKPIKEALEGIEGINSVSLEHDDKQNLWSVKVTTEEQNDVREKVFYKMAEINCPIYEMKSKKVSLEEIFLELTASDQSVAVKTENEKTDNETQTQKESETEEDKDEGGKES